MWDAGFAWSEDTERSTAGYGTWLRGPKTKVLVDAGCKLEDFTACSTPEAETVAGAVAVVRSAFPVNELPSRVYDRCIALVLPTGNATCELNIRQGGSKGMKHLRK